MVDNEWYFVMPWKMVIMGERRVSLKEAVDEISKHELTNPMYVTLKLYGRGGCRIHSISDGDKEIVVNKRYVVKPWESINRCGKNVTIAEAVDEIISCEESKMRELERRKAEKEEIERK